MPVSVEAQARQQALLAGFDPRSEDGQQLIAGATPTAQAEQETAAQLGLLEERYDEAAARADIREQQLRSAGLLGLANQFGNTRRRIAFDAARRGTMGGSRHLEREAQAEGELDRSAARVAADASQQAQGEREQDIAPLLGLESQLRAGDPYQERRRGLIAQGLADQRTSALGEFDFDQSAEAIRSGSQLNRADLIRQGFATAGAGIRAYGQMREEGIMTGQDNQPAKPRMRPGTGVRRQQPGDDPFGFDVFGGLR
jgi:hypothetical protein